MKKTSRPSSAAPGFVYAFANPLFPQWVKIGKAADWSKRLSDFQTYAPEDFYPVATLKTSDMGRAERLVHGLLEFRERRQKEFFCITPDVAVSVLRNVADSIGEVGGLTLYADGMPVVCFGKDGRPKSCRTNHRLVGVVFRPAVRGAGTVRMEVRKGEFVILKGSRLRPMTDALRTSDSSPIASIRVERESLEFDPVRCRDGRLLVDVPFKSASRALAVMLGWTGARGPELWTDEEGHSLSEYL